MCPKTEWWSLGLEWLGFCCHVLAVFPHGGWCHDTPSTSVVWLQNANLQFFAVDNQVQLLCNSCIVKVNNCTWGIYSSFTHSITIFFLFSLTILNCFCVLIFSVSAICTSNIRFCANVQTDHKNESKQLEVLKSNNNKTNPNIIVHIEQVNTQSFKSQSEWENVQDLEVDCDQLQEMISCCDVDPQFLPRRIAHDSCATTEIPQVPQP